MTKFGPRSGKPATPIFVLGLERSGTTWVANMLCGHPDVAGVQAEDHYGVHESIFFSHFARAYGDLADEGNFRRFTADFVASDYFLLTGIEEAWLWRRRPQSYPEAFRALMDELSRRRGARFWVEKSPEHSLLADELATAFPEARFVCVTRRPADLIRSRLWLDGRTPPAHPRRLVDVLRACAACSLYSRSLQRFSARCSRGVMTSYEALSNSLEDEMRRITKALGMAFDPSMLIPRYAPNTSFRSSNDRDQAMGAGERLTIALVVATLRIVPLRALHAVQERIDRRRGIVWPAWCWKRRPRPSQASSHLTSGEASRP